MVEQMLAHVEVDKIEHVYDIEYDYVDEREDNLAQLKLWPPYVCKVLKPLNEKKLVEPTKNEKFVTKTYIFYVTKCDEIFDLMVSNSRIVVLKGLKTPPLEKKRKKKSFVNSIVFLVIRFLNVSFSRIWYKMLLWKKGSSFLERKGTIRKLMLILRQKKPLCRADGGIVGRCH